MNEIFFETAVIQYTKQGIFIFLDSKDGWYPGKQILVRNGVLEIYDNGTFGLYGTERIHKMIHFDSDYENNHEILDKYCKGELKKYKKKVRDKKFFYLKKKEIEVKDFKKSGWNALKKGEDFRLLVLTGNSTITIGGGRSEIN